MADLQAQRHHRRFGVWRNEPRQLCASVVIARATADRYRSIFARHGEPRRGSALLTWDFLLAGEGARTSNLLIQSQAFCRLNYPPKVPGQPADGTAPHQGLRTSSAAPISPESAASQAYENVRVGWRRTGGTMALIAVAPVPSSRRRHGTEPSRARTSQRMADTTRRAEHRSGPLRSTIFRLSRWFMADARRMP